MSGEHTSNPPNNPPQNPQQKCTNREWKRGEVNCNEIIVKLYDTLGKEIRSLESNYIALLVPLISALAIFGIGLKAYLDNPCEQNLLFFTITSLATLLILTIIWFSSNIFAYTHRSNQLIVSNIEEKCCLYDEKILSKGWNLKHKLISCEFPDPPEIYKFFKCVSLFIGVLAFVISISIILYHNHKSFTSLLDLLKQDLLKQKYLKICLLIIPVVIFIICASSQFRWGFEWEKIERFCKRIYKRKSYASKLKELAIE